MKWPVLCALAAALAASAAQAGSIWARANATAGPPRVYSDDVARRIGDVLTIIINERSSIDNETKRKNDKKSDRSITSSGNVNLKDVATWWGGQAHDGFELPTISATSSGSTKFEGNAKIEDDRILTDRITVTVHDVLPNGNLVILGCRKRNVHGDTQVICVSGIVRPSDITFANTVNSDQVAEFNMVNVIKGPENRFTKPGWLGRILNFLSPW
jgi:flagellar L-ring protein precursor FlgH